MLLIIEVWATTDVTGGVAIAEIGSNDILYKKLNECPYALFMQFTVTPLTDIKLSIETGKKMMKKMAREYPHFPRNLFFINLSAHSILFDLAR